MPRQTSTGTCPFCQGTFSKGTITRHLSTCKQRQAALQGRDVGQDVQQKSCTCWLMATGHTGCISKCGPMPAWTPSTPFS